MTRFWSTFCASAAIFFAIRYAVTGVQFSGLAALLNLLMMELFWRDGR